MRRLGLRIAVALGGMAPLTGCAGASKAAAPSPQSVRVSSFTEASPVRALAALGDAAFAATDRGLVVWSLDTGAQRALAGLEASAISAMAADAETGGLWLATSEGVGRFDVSGGVYEPMPPPGDQLGPRARAARAVAPADAGSVWIGGQGGLMRADRVLGWRDAGLDRSVTALHRDRHGALWIGTETGLHRRRADGAFEAMGPRQGCDLARVRFLGEAPDGAVLAVGSSADGEQRVAVVRGARCASFRVAPAEPWTAAIRRGDETIVLSASGLYSLGLLGRGVRRLRREGLRLVPLTEAAGEGDSPYVVTSLGMRAPPGATSLAVADGDILIGTRQLGTARVRLTPRGPRVMWLRRSELAGAAGELSVACRAADDCIVATGDAQAWRFVGNRFRALATGVGVAYAAVRAPDGSLYLVLRHGDEPRVQIARAVGERVIPMRALSIETPGTAAAVSFALASPRGALWLGLSYVDDAGDRRSYGVAEVDVALGVVAYHGASRDVGAVDRGSLPIPLSANDAAFVAGEVWLSSHEGAVRVRGRDVTVYGERQGLASELLGSIAARPDGVVFVAGRAGVGVFDGSTWRFPRVLRRAVNTIRLGRDGRLWMATPRGVAVYDGARVRRLDARRGRLEDRILDLEIDPYGRIWALGKTGISLVAP